MRCGWPCDQWRVRVSWPTDEGPPARRNRAPARRRRHRRRRRRRDRRRPRTRRARGQGRRTAARPDGAAARRRQARDPHAEERGGGAGAAAPRHRARARGRRDRPLSGRQDLDRPADPGRLLLRLRVPARRHRHRRRLRPHRGEDEGAHQGRRAVRARGRLGRRGARAVPARGPAVQGRADRGPRQKRSSRRPGRDGLALHQRPLHRPLPRAARPRHEADQGVQAAVDRRRLLARRRRDARC